MPANYVLLERIELNATTSSVTFSNIPQSGYTDLKIVSSYRTNRSQIYDQLRLTFNGSSTAVYSFKGITGDGAGTSSESSSSVASIKVAPGGGNSATANTFTNDEIYIPNYLSSNNKSLSSEGVGENNATTAYVTMFAGLWANTAAINSVTLTPEGAGTFLQYSTFSLYGLAAVGTTPTIAPKAVGGSIYTDNTYWYHVFRTTDVFTPQITLSCDVLTVAGGGGGAENSAGGGGAGGLVYTASQMLSPNNYIATVGAGGASSASDQVNASKGANSTFTGGSLSLTTALGGGGGYGRNAGTGTNMNGGSGAGQVGGVGNTGTGTAGQGNNGGTGSNSAPNYGGGGGGGAGAVGGNGSSTSRGNGGIGLNTYSSWASATSTGDSGYYAGGGGGGSYQGGTGGNGGTGGGGAGSQTTGTAAITNTGGGGGSSGSGYSAGNGGSGIVIIRYAV